jgi:hypothetical protein
MVSKSDDAVVTAQYSESAISVDSFEHDKWKTSEPITIAHLWSGENAPASRHAEARLIWTHEELLVRFLCNQNEPLLVSPTPQVREKTIGLWERDVCEIFLAPNPDRPNRYFEFEAAPTGEWVDLAIEITPNGRYTDLNFQSGMSTAARVTADELLITIRIPWSERIPRPNEGERWRANLFRCIGLGEQRYLAWRPTFAPEPLFHVPEAFGWLSFA